MSVPTGGAPPLAVVLSPPSASDVARLSRALLSPGASGGALSPSAAGGAPAGGSGSGHSSPYALLLAEGAAASKPAGDAPPLVPSSAALRDPAGFVCTLACLAVFYASYRGLACARWGWACAPKDVVAHWGDVVSLCAYALAAHVLGPTPAWVSPWAPVAFFASAWAFGAAGNFASLRNDVTTGFGGASAPVYALAALGGAAAGAYAVASSSRTRRDAALTAGVLLTLLAVFGSSAAVAFASPDGPARIVFHPHHFLIFYLGLFLARCPDDAPTSVLRAVLWGVSAQGWAAWGSAPMLADRE